MIWNTPDRPVLLASQSPRRREILSQLGVVHTVRVPNLGNENDFLRADDLDASLQELAFAKAETVAITETSSLVFGCDTVVVIDNHFLGKPANDDEARRMLKSLRAREHTVMSGIALVCHDCDFVCTAVAATQVFFRDFSDAELSAYIATGESSDKAGAYAIQGYGAALVDSIQGCYYNVMGLPVRETINCLSAYINTVQKER